MALYNLSHVCLVTSLRDGMPLIAKEYIVSKVDGKGVLILSSLAGAASELGEAIIVNPNELEAISNALDEALSMPEEEQIRRNRSMQVRLQQYNIIDWASNFIKELYNIKELQHRTDAILPLATIADQICHDYANAHLRLIVLDVDEMFNQAHQDGKLANVSTKEAIGLLRKMAADPANEVVLIGDQNREALQLWFGDLPIGLIAEQGLWIKFRNASWQTLQPMGNTWKVRIFPILKMYSDRLPGSSIEEKANSLVWHYALTPSKESMILTRELLNHLIEFTSGTNVLVSLRGQGAIEVRRTEVDTNMALLHLLSSKHFDFLLIIGHDKTNESLFKLLPDAAYSVTVGGGQISAKIAAENYGEVYQFINRLSA